MVCSGCFNSGSSSTLVLRSSSDTKVCLPRSDPKAIPLWRIVTQVADPGHNFRLKLLPNVEEIFPLLRSAKEISLDLAACPYP